MHTDRQTDGHGKSHYKGPGPGLGVLTNYVPKANQTLTYENRINRSDCEKPTQPDIEYRDIGPESLHVLFF